MSEPTDRFVIETPAPSLISLAPIATSRRLNPGSSSGFSGSGRKMCSRGHRDVRSQQLPFLMFIDEHDIDKSGFEGDAPDEICSYCWSNTREELEAGKARTDTDYANRIGGVGYRLRWKHKGRARDEWYDIVVKTTMAELDRLVCRFTMLDDLHLRMYGLENEYLDSSLNVLPDHQFKEVGDRSYTKASDQTIGTVTERAGLSDGDRLNLVCDFGTPSYDYCLVKEVYEPDAIDDYFEDSEIINSTETAAIVREKRRRRSSPPVVTTRIPRHGGSSPTTHARRANTPPDLEPSKRTYSPRCFQCLAQAPSQWYQRASQN